MKAFNIKLWNKCELYRHLRKINKNKQDDFPNCFLSSGLGDLRGWSLSWQLREQGRRNQPWMGYPSIIAGHTHTCTCSDWDRLVVPVHFTCSSSGGGRKLEYLERTYPNRGEQANLLQEWPWIGIIPPPPTLKWKIVIHGSAVSWVLGLTWGCLHWNDP